jgi:sugar fermentation stimulation protein A
VGLYYRDVVVPLFSSRANKAAEELILKEIIPDLKAVYPEYTIGDSRFDFFCTGKGGQKHLVEVKACSLIEYGSAMFPDAPSDRALKHLEELAALSRTGYTCHELFVIVHSNPTRFIPNLHTDPQFAAALSRLGRAAIPGQKQKPESGRVLIHSALLRCDNSGRAVLAAPFVPVDLSHGALAESNSGSYLFLLEIPGDCQTTVGSLGLLKFKQGWYVYAGSARKNLSQRLARHQRRVRKQQHWHIDYLTPFAGKLKTLPVYSYRNIECDLAGELEKLKGRGIPGFGCSDCSCKSHLYYFKEPPMGNRGFVDMLLRYRHDEALKRDKQ